MSALLQAQKGALAALTITFHWWMLPALLVATAAMCVLWARAELRHCRYIGAGLLPCIVAVVLVLIALGVYVGHWT